MVPNLEGATKNMMDRVFHDADQRTVNKVKANIITPFIRKMSTLLSLTKSQSEQLLLFWKTMLLFIYPSSEEIVKRIKASYTTCVRQNLRDQQERKQLCKQRMDECSFFSLAIDSALIRNEHLFSCFARFTFEDRVVHTPLFFDVFHRLTGNEIAHWLFNKILEYGPSFEKLVSISTNGTSNMVGRDCGMTCMLKELIRERCTTRHVPFKDFHSVWGVAHRLNLVTRDFMGIKGINIIKGFSDWFSDRRRQTCYKQFPKQTNDRDMLKTKPQPSNTRWLFYNEVTLQSCHSQLSLKSSSNNMAI